MGCDCKMFPLDENAWPTLHFFISLVKLCFYLFSKTPNTIYPNPNPFLQMVVLMDPMEDPDDVLRANRSREKSYLFDVAFDFAATQVRPAPGIHIHALKTGLNRNIFEPWLFKIYR